MLRRICGATLLICVVIIAANLAFVVKDTFYYDITNLPTGTFVRSELNQELFLSEGLKLEIYQVEATAHYPAAVRAELYNVKTGERRNVYWQTGTESTVVVWNDDNIYEVGINGVTVDLRTKGYDCRDLMN